MIVGEIRLATIAEYGLMKWEQETKVDKKLEIEYIHDDTYLFKRVLFNHAFYEGLKATQWIGSDYYELTLQYISSPTSNKSHINLGFNLIHIPEGQELIETTFHSHILLNLARYTDKAIFSQVKEVFHQVAPSIFQTYEQGAIKEGEKMGYFEVEKLTNKTLDRLDRYAKTLRGLGYD